MSNDTSQAALYGKGVFTTIRVINGEPWLWEKHWRRLTSNAKALDIDIDAFPENNVLDELDKRLAAESVNDGRARITFFDQRSSDVWPGEIVAEKTAMSIVTGPPRHIPRPFRLTISPHTVNSTLPLAGLKTCNYLDQLMTLDGAKGLGFHEAVRVNERGHMTSACMASVFWSKGDQLFTPALSTGCLDGTTRKFVLEIVKCEEVEAPIDEVKTADGIFLTSAGLGVVAVDEFDGRVIRTTTHPILNIIPK